MDKVNKVSIETFMLVYNRLVELKVISEKTSRDIVIKKFDSALIEIENYPPNIVESFVTFGDLPKFNSEKATAREGYEFVAAKGVIDMQRRFIKIPSAMFNFEDYIGLFTSENGASNIANVENQLALLNGCDVEVRIKINKLPQIDPAQDHEKTAKKNKDLPPIDLHLNSHGDSEILCQMLDITKNALVGKQGIFEFNWRITRRKV